MSNSIIVTMSGAISERKIVSSKEMQKVVDGYIEAVDLSFGILWCNEEFLYRPDLSMNLIASLSCAAGGRDDLAKRGIGGDIFITGGLDVSGDYLDVTSEARRTVEACREMIYG